MMNYSDKDYLKFFIEQFKIKSSGEYKYVMVYPLRGEAYAIKKHPDEMVPTKDKCYIYTLNKKEVAYFRRNKSMCNVWIKL